MSGMFDNVPDDRATQMLSMFVLKDFSSDAIFFTVSHLKGVMMMWSHRIGWSKKL